MLSITEENYLKSIYKIAESDGIPVSTNSVAARMQTTAASVTDMIKRLSDKELLEYEKYRGVQLTEQGSRVATQLIRKHLSSLNGWIVFWATHDSIRTEIPSRMPTGIGNTASKSYCPN
jgi:Mn-dependent DtxR family transcriptional regulator